MKQFVTIHDFQALFLVPAALAFFSILVTYIRPPATPAIALVTCALFCLTVYRVNQAKNELAMKVNPVTAQFQTIYNQLPQGSKVFVCGDRYSLAGAHLAVPFYLAGSYFTSEPSQADYMVVKGASTLSGAVTLTDNPTFNLLRLDAQAELPSNGCHR
jgi:hypothetical protein